VRVSGSAGGVRWRIRAESKSVIAAANGDAMRRFCEAIALILVLTVHGVSAGAVEPSVPLATIRLAAGDDAGAVDQDQNQSAPADQGSGQDQQDNGTSSGDDNAAKSAPVSIVDVESAIKALAADDADVKMKAVQFLGTAGDSRAIPVLRALANDGLFATGDGKLVYADGAIFRNALSGKEVPGLKSDDLTEIVANNLLRGAIQGVIGQLGLAAADASTRRYAAEALAANPTPEGAAMLRAALAKESNAGAKRAMVAALAQFDLSDSDPAKRLAAVKSLADSNDPNVRGMLQHLLDSESDAKVRTAAQSAIASMGSRLAIIGVGVNLFEGLSLGSILLLAAIGLSITFGVMGVINMAHGEMIMLGAYSTYVVQQLFVAFLPPSWLDAYLVASLPVAFLVTGAIGIALERGIIRFLYGRALETLLATWGVSLILQQLVRTIFGAPNKAVDNPSWMTGGFEPIGGAFITWNRLVILVFCFVVLGVLGLLLKRTSFGLHMRAVTQNREMAAAMGIRTARIDALTFGLGSGIAGIAGVALSQIGNVSPNLGTLYIVDSFMVVVFGGVGSLFGTLAGAMSLGIVNKLLEPVAGAVLGKVVVLVAIILFIQRRPRGLFALRGRAVEN
jgi:urea transport system permease protein